MPAKTFPVALTADFYDAHGKTKYRDIGVGLLDAQPHITYKPFAEHRPEIGPDQIGDAAAVIVLTPRVTAKTLSHSENLLAVGRFGVGYDSVDVPACTSAGVLMFITAGAVDRSVAEATVGWMISLTHNALAKHRLVSTGQWDIRSQYMGTEIRDHTLGIVGFGGIARGLVELLKGFGMKQPIAYDPFPNKEAADKLGVKLVSLDEVMKQADYVSVHCPLTEKTRNLIGAREIGMMKPTSYLINTARGGIVNEDALYDALKHNRIAGAALDCFEVEPVTKPSRFAEFENVRLAPHCIAWTDELFRDIGRAACQAVIDLSLGKKPRGVLNPEIFDRPGFQAKWERLRINRK